MEQTFNAFDKLAEEVGAGIRGENESIPVGFPKLGRYINYRRRIFTLIFSSSGAGKSALSDEMMLNSCEFLMKNPEFKKTAKFVLFSQERSKHLRIAKWIVRRIFIDTGKVIQVPKLLGWWEEKMNKDEHDLFLMYKDYVDRLLDEYIEIYEGARTPNDIHRIMKGVFAKSGIYEDLNEFKKIYIPHNEHELVIPIIDHGNLIRTTREFPGKKQAIDQTVHYMQGFRDLEGASPVWIAQINRNMEGVTRAKDSEQEPTLGDIKESSDVDQASDIAISLFDPVKYKQSSKTGYDPTKFIDKWGAKYFRSIQINKSTYGEDDLRIPMAFNGFSGQFVEMGKRSDLDENAYNDLLNQVLSKNYFRKDKSSGKLRI